MFEIEDHKMAPVLLLLEVLLIWTSLWPFYQVQLSSQIVINSAFEIKHSVTLAVAAFTNMV